MYGFTDFSSAGNPAHPVGGRVPLRTCRLSPSERRVCFPSYRACDKARGPHMVSERCINRWSVSPTHGSLPPAMPSPRHHSPSCLPAHHSKSNSSYVGSPPPSPASPACVYCGELGHSVWQCHGYNIPCSSSSSQVHPPATTAADSLPIPNRIPIPSNPPSVPDHFQLEVPHSPEGVIPPSTALKTQECITQVNDPLEPMGMLMIVLSLIIFFPQKSTLQ